MPGAPSPDLLPKIDMGGIAAMHDVQNAANTRISQEQLDLMNKINQERAKQKKAPDVLRELAEADEKNKYDTGSYQRDIARFGGDAGKLNQDGIAEKKDGASPAQQERLEKGRKAIENVSAVMFYMDILKLPQAARQAEIARLEQTNPSFKALNIPDFDGLKDKAIVAMLSDEGIQKIIASMPDADQYRAGDKGELVLFSMLTDPQFRDNLSANFHAIHEELLKLPVQTQEGGAKLQADLGQATLDLKNRAISLAERIKNDPAFRALGIDASKAEQMLMRSGNELDFKKNLAVEMGVPVGDIDAAIRYTQIQDQIKAKDKEITKAVLDKVTAPNRRVLEEQKQALVDSIAGIIPGGRTEADIVTAASIYNRAVALADQSEIRTDIQEGIRANITRKQVETQIANGESQDLTNSLNARLDKEDAIIRKINAVLGKTLAQTWADQMEEANGVRDELMKKMLEQASTEDEKELIRKMNAEYVEYDAAKRETTIHGESTMRGMKLLAMKDRGLKLEMARAMGYITADQVSDVFDIGPGDIAKGETASYMQQKAVDQLLDSIPADKKPVLEKMFTDHGSEYRQKIYGSYLTMDQYIKENGILGFAIRLGRKVKYDGPARSLVEMYTGRGDSTVNADEMAEIFKYCKPDIEAAVQSNREASNFVKRMQEKGMIGNADLLKKLAWLIFVVLGLGGGALAAIPGGMTALSGAGIGAGIGSLGLGAAKVADSRTI